MDTAIIPSRRDESAVPRRAARLVVAVDFHGVVCAHPEGSRGDTEPGWPEVPGAVEWLVELVGRYDVHIVSARFGRPGAEGARAMLAARDWLLARGIPMAWMGAVDRPLLFSAYKPACVLWVDDRAFCFRGVFPTLEEIGAFRPWNR